MSDDSFESGAAARVRAGFAAQAYMKTIGAELVLVEPGVVEIALAHRADLTQQHGFLHAGVVTAIVDSACGFAAYTLMPAGAEVLSVEFKLNLVRPAKGERFVARGQVLKPGATLTVTRGDVWAGERSDASLVATMLATMIRR